MRRLVLAILMVTSAAAADPAGDVGDALMRGTFGKLLAKQVRIRGVVFESELCRGTFGKPTTVSGGADLAQLAECMQYGFQAWAVQLHTGKVALASLADDQQIVELELKAGHVVAIAPYGATAADGDLPTFAIDAPDVVPGEATMAAIRKSKDKRARAIFKLCRDAGGKVTSRRLVDPSGLAAFDNEVNKSFDPQLPPPKPMASCVLAEARTYVVKDLVQPVKIEKIEPTEAEQQAAPAAPVPQNVVPTVLETLRIAGDKLIAPDDATKVEIQKAKRDKVIASFKLCVDNKGEVYVVVPLKSSGFPAYDRKLAAAMRSWKYKPFVQDGAAIPVCTAATFIYSQH